MRDISELNSCFDKYLDKLKENLYNANEDSAEYMFKEATDRVEIPDEARNIHQFVEYAASIRKSSTEEDGETLKTSVYSDLRVGGDSKWADVPVGAFLEWGTGPLGEDTNDYPHGYPYTTRAPWDEHTAIQEYFTGTWGIAARPHLYPALIATKPIHLDHIKGAIEEAWKK